MVPRGSLWGYMETSVNKELLAVAVQRLELGMFVVELDRPWSETPFRFQGFEILSQSEIDLLQTFCKTVYVDPNFTSTVTITRESLPVISSVDSTEALEHNRLRLRRMLTNTDPHHYPKPQMSRGDFKTAAGAYEYAIAQRDRLLRALGNNKPVRAAHCRGVVEAIAVRVADHPDSVINAAMLSKSRDDRSERSISTAVWCAVFARYLQLPPQQLVDLAVGGLLLDIGMQKLAPTLLDDDAVYNKRQKLAVQAHVRLGLDMLERIQDFPKVAIEMVSEHQERPGGIGYPARKDNEQRGAAGMLAGLVDQFDVMITGNARRAPLAPSEAMGELLSASEASARDTLLVEQFIQAVGRFPSGSIVELSSGEIGVISLSDPERRLRPVLHVVADSNKQPTSVREVDLKSSKHDPSKPKALWIVRGHPIGAFGIQPGALFG